MPLFYGWGTAQVLPSPRFYEAGPQPVRVSLPMEKCGAIPGSDPARSDFSCDFPIDNLQKIATSTLTSVAEAAACVCIHTIHANSESHRYCVLWPS